MAHTFIIDGKNFCTLEEFYDEVGNVLIPGQKWGKNLEAFNDILYDWINVPDDEIIIKWINSDISKERLGYSETVRQLEKRLQKCHPTNRNRVWKYLEEAKQLKGPTVLDWLVDILKEDRPYNYYKVEIIID